MLRRIRCRSCGTAFYTSERINECQDCTGTHDRHEQAERDAATVRAVNSNPETDESQSINPRTGAPKATRKKQEKSK